MTDCDSARAQIADLVQRFAHDKAKNKLAAYNKGQTRHDYILPLWLERD